MMHKSIKKFLRCEKGNIAIMGTFAMIPILSLVVGGMELGEINKVTQSMQHAADQAVIAAFDEPDLSWSKRIRRADAFFDTNFPYPKRVEGLSKKLSGRQTRQRVELSYKANAKIDSLFGEMSPFASGSIRVEAKAIYIVGSGNPPRLIASEGNSRTN